MTEVKQKEKKISVAAMADFHNLLPEKIPQVDLLIVAGDIFDYSPRKGYLRILREQEQHWENKFLPWLKKALEQVDQIVLIGGNQDVLLERGDVSLPERVVYLEDQLFEYKGLKIYGFPWTDITKSNKTAFAVTAKLLKKKAKQIPDCDILVSHGPAFGCGDKTSTGVNKGIKALRETLAKRKIRRMVCGHIHAAAGVYKFNDTKIYSVALTKKDKKTRKYKILPRRMQVFTIRPRKA
jgi:Icc-related predicted phosphoesterase